MTERLRLSAEHYKKDMHTLTTSLRRARSAHVATLDIDISSAYTEEVLTVRLSTDKLWFLGFQNNDGDWFYFQGHNQGGTELVANGSYLSLGASHNLTLSHDGIMLATQLVYKSAGSGLDSGQKTALLHLIVAVSEALRFHHVLWSVQTLIKTPASNYSVHWKTIHSWEHLASANHGSIRMVPV